MGARLKLPLTLGWVTAGAMVLASLIGLVWPGVYRDVEWIRAAWMGTDIVTLAVAVPVMVVGLVMARRGSLLGELLVYASFAYSIYGYAYYLFGAELNALLPLYVLLLVAPLIGLAVSLATLDADMVAARFGEHGVRYPAAYMLFTGVGLGIAWLAQWAAYIFGGTEPSTGAEAFRLIAGLDLSLIVPFMTIGGALLWKRRPWGFVLAAMYTVKGATYTMVLTMGSIIGGLRGIEGSAAQVPIWGAWTLAGAAAAVLLLRGLRGSGVRG